ncbi:hypothetical protein EGH24_08850 [Halonotius terrestris]|uniref:Uncharacterized protein n=1 Tax=Halonotius terrestris TaxID=2487750 RepID=A0A8J8PBU9_9EURY|nr:hypothetical protein [Halonotius terrestris]TQQ81228.1 hypothetical protein EGH24_08850 [Halonotius terrestris]
MTDNYGETWVYESIVGALPGLELSNTHAVAIQFGVFQVGIVLFAWLYDLWSAALAGTAAVFVAAVGSVAMHRLGTKNRAAEIPEAYYRLLFGSSIEVVLSVLAFIALVTHLFVFDAQTPGTPLIASLFGPEPPIVVVYLVLLVSWDLCYRIGTSWWVAVVSLWRAIKFPSEPSTARRFIRLDLENVGFAVTQLVLVPFLLDQPFLLVAVSGHVVAVTVVSALSIWLTRADTRASVAPADD